MNCEELLAPIQHLLPEIEEKVPDIDMRETIFPSYRLKESAEDETAAGETDQTQDIISLGSEPENTANVSKTEESNEVKFTVNSDNEEDSENTSVEDEIQSSSQAKNTNLVEDENQTLSKAKSTDAVEDESPSLSPPQNIDSVENESQSLFPAQNTDSVEEESQYQEVLLNEE